MTGRIHPAMQDAQNEDARLRGAVVDRMGHRIVPANALDNETIIHSEIRVLRRHLDLRVERLRVPLGLNRAEMFDPVEGSDAGECRIVR